MSEEENKQQNNNNQKQAKNPVDRAFDKIKEKAIKDIDNKIDAKVDEYIKAKKVLDGILESITGLEVDKSDLVKEYSALRKGIPS